MPRSGELLSTYAHQPVRCNNNAKTSKSFEVPTWGVNSKYQLEETKDNVACRLWSLILLAPRQGTSQLEYVADRDLGFGWWETGNSACDWWTGYSYLNTLPGWKFYTHGCPISSLLWYNISSSVIGIFSILPVEEVSSSSSSLSAARGGTIARKFSQPFRVPLNVSTHLQLFTWIDCTVFFLWIFFLFFFSPQEK